MTILEIGNYYVIRGRENTVWWAFPDNETWMLLEITGFSEVAQCDEANGDRLIVRGNKLMMRDASGNEHDTPWTVDDLLPDSSTLTTAGQAEDDNLRDLLRDVRV
jgi:hypothetical protein